MTPANTRTRTGSVTVSGRPVGSDDPVTLTMADGRISAIEAGGDDGHLLAPGLVDVHCHGGGGHEFGVDDPIAAASAHHRRGTTTVMASLVSARPAVLRGRVAALAPHVGPTVAGIHLEGPFLALAQCGAHDPGALHPPDVALLDDLAALAHGGLAMVTLAPELAGAPAFMERALDHGLVVAVGHTEADAATVDAVATRVHTHGGRMVATHLFNGMPPLDHRAPGPVLASLGAAAAGRAWVELIADGTHLAPATIAATFGLVGDAVVLISDAIAATGMGDGRFRLGDLEVEVTGRVCELVHGDSLAGSVTPLLTMVRTAIAAGVDPGRAIAAATRHPADLLGRHDVGRLAVGARADVLVLDDDLGLISVWRDGARLEPAIDQA